MKLIVSMPHDSLGRVGRGLVASALRLARSLGFGFTRSPFVFMVP